MKCFYHKSDLDGHCSGAIIKLAYLDCEMIGVDYNDTIDFSTIENLETVFVVDFSFSVEEMTKLLERASLVWIDHHKSSIEKLSHLAINGVQEVGKAGCELTWQFIYPEIKVPLAITLLGRYDVWDHKNPQTLPFQYGMRAYDSTLPSEALWDNVFKGLDIEAITTVGQIILDYQTKQDTMYVKGMVFEAEFHGYRALVLNKPYSNSKVFDSVYDPDKHDIMILFEIKSKQFEYSLYCDKPNIDVSKIAIKYDGGGHAGAAGFYSTKYLF